MDAKARLPHIPNAAGSDKGRDSAVDAVAATLMRVIGVVQSETDLLASGAPVVWQDFVDRKSRLLLELSRTQRLLAGGPDARLLDLAQELRDVLKKNKDAVGLQVQALRQIVGMLTSAVHEYASDGTYSQARPRR
jgi:hypothetical protein